MSSEEVSSPPVVIADPLMQLGSCKMPFSSEWSRRSTGGGPEHSAQNTECRCQVQNRAENKLFVRLRKVRKLLQYLYVTVPLSKLDAAGQASQGILALLVGSSSPNPALSLSCVYVISTAARRWLPACAGRDPSSHAIPTNRQGSGLALPRASSPFHHPQTDHHKLRQGLFDWGHYFQ